MHEDENPVFYANMQLDIGIELLHNQSRKSRIILTARDYFTTHLEVNDKRLVTANFWAGKYYYARKQYKKAILSWETNLPVFNNLEGATHPLELSSHAFLIGALEKIGASDEATKHCIAIGAMTPWDDSQDPRPLYRQEPKYPLSYAKNGKSGWVKMGFTISASGMVTQAKVIDSKGGQRFETASLAAVEAWRYAPKFEQGEPTEFYATVQLDFKVAK